MPAASTRPRPPAAFITASEVAGLIGYTSAVSFLQNRKRLEEREDFPRPLPTCLRPLKWRRSQIEAWVEAAGRPASHDAALDLTAKIDAPRTSKLVMLNEARTA